VNWNTLAQLVPYDGSPDSPKGPAPHEMSFSDFQNGMKQWNDGGTNNTFRNGLIVMVAIVAIVAIVLHIRQRLKHRPELNSAAALGRELCRVIPFPFGTRLLLWWVARSTRVHVATLLLSAQAFDNSLALWAGRHTFHPIRKWGADQLNKLKPILFSDC
jgi:hypothetical protein